MQENAEKCGEFLSCYFQFCFQVTRPYVTFILSLLISDAFASLLLGIQLLFGSYLPVVHDIILGGCLMMISEALRLAGVLITVFHLFIMVSIHLGGVMYPVKFAEVSFNRR